MSNVNPLFQTHLGRAATAADEAFYGGQTDRQVTNALLASPEYRQRATQQLAFPTMAPSQVSGLSAGTPEARQNVVTQAYRDIFGRAPEAEGLAYWSDPTRFASAMGDGSFFNDFVGPGVMADASGSNPWDKTAQWADYRQRAEASTSGIGRMHGIFSDYGSIPTDATARNALFYMSPEEAAKSVAGNPLLSGAATLGTGQGGGAGGGSGSQVPAGFYRSDDPMFNEAVRIGNEIVIDGVRYWEPI